MKAKERKKKEGCYYFHGACSNKLAKRVCKSKWFILLAARKPLREKALSKRNPIDTETVGGTPIRQQCPGGDRKEQFQTRKQERIQSIILFPLTPLLYLMR
jgi:hypothetical protein